jgi:hypothetical protein
LDDSTRSSSKKPRRRTLGQAPKEDIGDFTKDALDDGQEYQEHESMAGLTCEGKSDHMEGIPDYLDPASKPFNAVMSSLKPDEAAIYSFVE